MPLYEYKCDKCGQRFEVIQKFSDEPLTVHEACGGAVERLLSTPALQFKGSGFYITDYKKSGKSATSSPSKNGGSSSSSGDSSSSSSKSDSSSSSSSTTTASKDSSSK